MAVLVEADRLRALEASREIRQVEAARLLVAVGAAAEALSRGRAHAAGRLAVAVEAALGGLGFRQTTFQASWRWKSASEIDSALR